MTIALKVRIGDLLPEFLANALILFGAFQTAGTIATGTLQAVTDGLHHFFLLNFIWASGGIGRLARFRF